MSIEGGCLCGAVRYQCLEQAVLQFNCHCRDCQRTTGSAYAPIAFFPKDSVRIFGEMHDFQCSGGSGKIISRGFCPICGSQLFGSVELLPELISIRAGTFDEPANFQPRANLFLSHAAPWDQFDQTLNAFDQSPPQGT